MAVVFRGAEGVPPSRFDASSLGIFQPGLALRTWLGLRRADRRVPIYNLFNRTPTPIAEGWSVRRTQVRDFRGGTLTYDSHNGTDFAVPPGTVVVAAAPGRVLRVSAEFNRGGLKVFVDHGRGLITTSNHLGRALVREGDLVRRGQAIALSGASGIDMFLMFPWNAPHVHFNVWLNGVPVDPFAEPDETSLWRRRNDPVPHDGEAAGDADAAPTAWDGDAVAAAIASCAVASVRDALGAVPRLDVRAMAVLFEQNYYPTRFPSPRAPYAATFPREPRLDLPFRAADAAGIVFP
jgi:murein DD-endopeptidase MepM/ murein hydrolase activator NlpD